MDENNIKKASKRKRNKAKSRDEMDKKSEKSKEQVLAERQAKKAAKKQQQAKGSQEVTKEPSMCVESPKKEIKSDTPPASPAKKDVAKQENEEKSREQVIAEREAKKLAKQSAKKKVEGNEKTDKPQQHQQPKAPTQQPKASTQQSKAPQQQTQKSDEKKQLDQKLEAEKKISDIELTQKMENLHISDTQGAIEKKTLTKAERRAIQEAQRAAKAKAQQEKVEGKKPPPAKSQELKLKPEVKSLPSHKHSSSAAHKVKQFKHLYTEKCDLNIDVNGKLHPAILKLGIQYANDVIVGSNSRCYAFLNAMRTLINDFVTPEEKIFSRALETEIQKSVEFLQKCRPLAVSMANALKHIKMLISQETSAESDLIKKQRIISKIETYAQEEIETAAISISLKVREKISDDDVILTFGCSSLIKRSLVEAWKDGAKNFSVIVVDSRPDYEGQIMLNSLTKEGISCTYVLINAISFIMPKVTKVFMGAHALLANGYVMSRVGTAQISMVANYFNVPVLICCETHKFSERVQTDSFVYNELGDPNALAWNKNSRTKFEYLKDWESIQHLTPLNLRYDMTPPELITAVVTEVALLPCTSVQVILRVKPSE